MVTERYSLRILSTLDLLILNLVKLKHLSPRFRAYVQPLVSDVVTEILTTVPARRFKRKTRPSRAPDKPRFLREEIRTTRALLRTKIVNGQADAPPETKLRKPFERKASRNSKGKVVRAGGLGNRTKRLKSATARGRARLARRTTR
ncbi:hypothetical protein EVAR_27890_1 [Eumeta japonica]|uniref:Uncharacterized protein n=1 Tax=Eumeta variegata TaxID=151549 RepID=A0A4C1UV08_EUMVA|nr:hypothetical protein EVAR_27890_1 [Eumeta japonica]